MKAILINRFGDPSVLEAGEISSPVIREDEILVETEAGSVNPVDWKQRKGNHRFILGFRFPIVLGYDVAGRVIQTGKEIKKFREGDFVCGVLPTKSYGGGLAQYVKGTEICFAKVPSSEEASHFAILPLAALTSLQALRDKGNIKKGYKVLIIGAAGGVGHYAIQLAQLFEAEIFAVSSEKHKGFLNTLGQFHFIDYKEEDVLKLNDRFQIIFDCVGKYSFLKCMHLLQPGGTYVNTLPRPKIFIHKLLSLFTRGKKVKTLIMKHNAEDLENLVNWVAEGKIKLCIDREYTVTDIEKAHRYSEGGHTEGKILIRYSW
jgi:NADPH:quinone reductase-like Zn-dependent oxidoreductase